MSDSASNQAKASGYSYGKDNSSFQHPFSFDIREILDIAKDSSIDPEALLSMTERISNQMHLENLRYWDLRDKKLEMDFHLAKKSTDNALALSIASLACGSVIAYLVDPWAGVAITTAGAGVAGIGTLKRALNDRKKSTSAPPLIEVQPS